MIELDYRSKKPIYEQIVEQIKLLVVKGVLAPGDAIPSVRKMAQELEITPSTVAKAYQELERQEVIMSIRMKGTFIADNAVHAKFEPDMDKINRTINSALIDLKRAGFLKNQVLELVGSLYDQL